MKLLGQAFVVAVAFLPLTVLLLRDWGTKLGLRRRRVRPAPASGAATRRLGQRSRTRPGVQPPMRAAEDVSLAKAPEGLLVKRLLAGELDSAAYRERMTALARREATRPMWDWDELEPP